MRRLFVVMAALLLSVFAFSSPAQAQGEHFTRNGVPVCHITSTTTATGTTATVTCTGELAGLGNEDLVLDLSVSGFALYQCQNQGGNTAPGQNRVLVGPAVSQTTIPAAAIKNGRTKFTTNPAILTAPATVSAEVAGCPNNNWIGVNPQVTVTNIELLISQSELLFTCTASDPNGLTGDVTLTCV